MTQQLATKADAEGEQRADRIRDALAGVGGVPERQRFGGLAFLHHGNMMCGVTCETLMLRLGSDVADSGRTRPPKSPTPARGRSGIGRFDLRGRRDPGHPAQRWSSMPCL